MIKLLFSGTAIMAGETVVLLANTIIAGNMIGETAIAAINLVMPIYSFIAFIAVAVSMGTAVKFSQETGKFNLEGARRIFSQGVIAAVVLGVATFVVVSCIKGLILKSAVQATELYSMASDYYSVLAFMAILYPLLALLLDTVYSDGGEKISGIAYVPLAGMSIVLSIILCPKMGIAGIALGTVIGQALALLVLFTHFFTKKCTLKFRWYFNIREFLISMKYSLADSGSFLCWSILLVIVNSFFLTKFGGEKLPVLTAVASLMEITLIFDGVGAAIQPLIGLYRGEKNTLAIEHLMKTAAVIAFAEGVILSAIVILFPGLLAGALGIDDPEIYSETIRAMRIYGTSLLIPSLMLLLSSYYLYTDKFNLVLINIFLLDFLMPLVCILIYGNLGGMTGVWIGFAQGNLMAIVAMAIITIMIYGKDEFPLYLDRKSEGSQLVANIDVDEKKQVKIPDNIRNFMVNHGTDEKKARRVLEFIEKTLTETPCKGKGHLYVEFMVDSSDEETRIIMRDSGELREMSPDADEDMVSDNTAMGMNRMNIVMNKHDTIE